MQGIQDLKNILKRLEIIKSLIQLEEKEEIIVQLEKLKQYELNEELKGLTENILAGNYLQSIEQINTLLTQNHSLSLYNDVEINALKLEISGLEAELNALEFEKSDIEKTIYEFGIRHEKELGEIILKILELRKEKQKGMPEEAEAEKDYTEYKNAFEESKDKKLNTLSEEEQKDLKQLYRKAVTLCHPDVVNEEQKEQAEQIFIELKNAYDENDLARVNEILTSLKSGNLFIAKSESITEKKKLIVIAENLRMKIKKFKTDIEQLKETEAYTTILKIDNWEEYFTESKVKLSKELEHLQLQK